MLSKAKTKHRFFRYLRSSYALYLMLIPMFLFFVLFRYKPLTHLVIAFKKYSPFRGISGSPWVGFRWFSEFFSSPYAWRTIRNTLAISLSTLLVCFPAPIIFALLLNELRAMRLKKTVQTVSYVPHFISTVVVCSIVINFLSPTSGVVNAILAKFGLSPIYFLSMPSAFLPIYVFMELWRSTGYGSIVYIASLAAIDQQLYEAASVDGAGRFRQLVHITLPGILPTIVIMLLTRLGGILNVGYEAILLLYNPSVYETADVISTFVYRTGLAESRYDYATAVGLFNSVVALLLVASVNRISRRLTETGLW